MYKTDGKEVIKTYKKLHQDRNVFEDLWDEAFRLSYPMRGQRFQSGDDASSSNAQNSRRDKAVIFDTTGKDSARLLASSILSGLTPPNMQWFNLAIPDMDLSEVPQDAREWLEFSSNKLWKMIHASNYDAEAFEFMLDMVIGGICGIFIDWIEGEGFKFEFLPLETLYVCETMRNGMIDSFYRRVVFTAEQMANKFGEANLPEGAKTILKTDPKNGKQFKVIHTIRPRIRKGKQSKGKLSKTLPFESVWVCMETGKTLMEGGFHEFPAVIPRWLKIPESSYALGPFDDALPDVKSLNYVVQMLLTNADMAIAGTYVAKDDGVLNPATSKIKPRQILFAANPDNIKPLTTAGDFRVTSTEIDRLQRNIRRILMADQLQPQDGPAMTATEVHVRTQLVRQLLGPVYGRFSAEFLQPLIARTFGLAFRAGMFGEAPESLGGYQFVPQYQSPLARAQKQEDVSAMTQFEGAVGQLAGVNPEVLDLYDFDGAVRHRADLLGVPTQLIRRDREVEDMRKERQEEQAQAQEQMMAMEAAKAGPQQ